MEQPDVLYTRSGDVSIAYQVLGEGPIDVVFARGLSGDLISTWEQPLLARHALGLASLGRLLMLDKRGTGLSDRTREVPTLETRMDDLRAVMDAVGSERAVFWTGQEGAGLAILFAATYPERTAGIALIEPWVRGRQTADYPWAPSDEEWAGILSNVRDRWGQRDFFLELLHGWAPEVADDPAFGDWFVAHMRRSMSPGAALSFYRTMRESDVTDVLSAVRVPVLVVFKPSQRAPAEFLAQRVRDTELVELPRLSGMWTWVDDETHVRSMAAIGRLVARVAETPEPERGLATVLFTDLVGSTERAAALGDRRWHELLERHNGAVRRELARFRGTEVDTSGDGVFATFDGPARAIRCACRIRETLEELGLEMRAGIHTGECEIDGEKPRGIAVHTGARIASLAGPGEVLVSGTVKDLVAGSGIEFEDRGVQELRGVPGSWRVFAVRAA